MSFIQELDVLSDTSIDGNGTPVVAFIEEDDSPQTVTTYSSPLRGAYSDSVWHILSLATQIPWFCLMLAIQTTSLLVSVLKLPDDPELLVGVNCALSSAVLACATVKLPTV